MWYNKGRQMNAPAVLPTLRGSTPLGRCSVSKLTTRRQTFIDQYFVCGFNGTEAARMAGFKGNRATLAAIASQLLRVPLIRDAINQRLGDPTRVVGLPQRRTAAGYVYIVRADNGLVKIGKTDGLTRRLDKLNSLLPYDLDVLYVFPVGDRGQVEQALHKHFDALRVRGEWFRLSDDQIATLPVLVATWEN